jgi:hypothetical protein
VIVIFILLTNSERLLDPGYGLSVNCEKVARSKKALFRNYHFAMHLSFFSYRKQICIVMQSRCLVTVVTLVRHSHLCTTSDGGGTPAVVTDGPYFLTLIILLRFSLYFQSQRGLVQVGAWKEDHLVPSSIKKEEIFVVQKVPPEVVLSIRLEVKNRNTISMFINM